MNPILLSPPSRYRSRLTPHKFSGSLCQPLHTLAFANPHVEMAQHFMQKTGQDVIPNNWAHLKDTGSL